MPITRDNITYDSKYGDIPGLNEAFNQYVEHLGANRSDSAGNRQEILNQFGGVGDAFKSQFKNFVGREATPQELERFFGESGVTRALPGSGGANAQNIRNLITQFIGDTFQQEANDAAQQKTQDLSGKYASLADSYLEMGKKSLGNLADELRTYSTSLFEKLRPQLNLAAQAGGYADSGGQTLQEQGALTDLANQDRRTLSDKAYEIETNANNIRYGGMAAPVSMASQFAANQPYVLQQQAGAALDLGNQNWLRNQDYLRQLQLAYGQQKWANDSQPSFGTRLWQGLAERAANSAVDSLGQAAKAKAGGF